MDGVKGPEWSSGNGQADQNGQERNTLDSILARAVAEKLAGATPDIERLASQHPDLASELKVRWDQLNRVEDPIGPLVALNPEAVLSGGSELGEYTVKSELGRGGMGVVYEAEQQHPRRDVALKVIQTGGHDDPHTVRMFEREIQALARLKHPGIASIYGAGRTAGGCHFFAMELVRGVPLNLHASRHGLDLRQRLELFRRVCEAVNSAHQRGVIHRDLKPGNILVDAGGQPKVLDFGLARIVNPGADVATLHSHVGRIQGTVPYMSPEQARGSSEDVDLRSDVYSLGVVLYELMTDRLPFDVTGVPVHEAVRRVCEDSPPRPGSVDRSLRGDIETIILKALHANPSQRYQSALELALDIERHLDHRPILARPTLLPSRVIKAVRRRPARALVVSFSLLAVALASWLTTYLVEEEATRRRTHYVDLEDRTAYAVHVASCSPRPLWSEEILARRINTADLCLAELIDLAPDATWPRMQRALLEIRLKRSLDVALEDLSFCSKQEPHWVAPHVWRHLAHHAHQESPDPFAWDDAAMPQDPEDLFFCAEGAIRIRDKARAKLLYSQLLKVDPANYWALIGRARSFSLLDEKPLKIQDLQLAVHLRPDIDRGYLLLGGVLEFVDRPACFEILHEGARRFPDNLLIPLTLAQTYARYAIHLEERDPEEWHRYLANAETYFRHAMKVDTSGGTHRRFAQFLLDLERLDEAIPFFEEAIALASPRWIDLCMQSMSEALIRQGRMDDAREVLQQVVANATDPRAALTDLGHLEQKAGNSDIAIDHYMEVVESELTNWRERGRPPLYRLAWMRVQDLLCKAGRSLEAREVMHASLEWAQRRVGDSDGERIRKDLACSYMKDDDRRSAFGVYYAFVQKYPEAYEPYYELARFHRSHDQASEALANYGKALEYLQRADERIRRRIRYEFAGYLRRLERPAEAAEHYRFAEMQPSPFADDRVVAAWARMLIDDSIWSAEEEQAYFVQAPLRGFGHRNPQTMRYDDAAHIMQTGIDRYGDSIRMARIQGQVLSRLREYEASVSAFDRAIQMASERKAYSKKKMRELIRLRDDARSRVRPNASRLLADRTP